MDKTTLHNFIKMIKMSRHHKRDILDKIMRKYKKDELNKQLWAYRLELDRAEDVETDELMEVE